MSESCLSVVLLTKKESANMPALLNPLDGLDCRVFIVDSGSADGTVAIAEAAGCHFVEHPFVKRAQLLNRAMA